MTNLNHDGEAYEHAVTPAGNADSETNTTVQIPESTETAEESPNLSRRKQAALDANTEKARLVKVEQELAELKAEKAEMNAMTGALDKFGVTRRELAESQTEYDGILKEYTDSGMNMTKSIEFAIRDLKSSKRSGSTLPPIGNGKVKAKETISKADLNHHLTQRNQPSRDIVDKVKSGLISVR
tara:strand:- start:44 stop:592 length:549 start_codon:yes stop_codon:yes gene_type:complete